MSSVLAGSMQVCGFILMAVVLADAFLTVLYARVGVSVFSNQMGRLTWKLWRRVALRCPRRRRGTVLSFCGPVLMVVLVAVWSGGLALGAAMIIYPRLGTSVRLSGGSTPVDFISALFAAASSLSIVGAGNFEPQTSAYRLLYMVNSLIGVCMISLTLTYLMQVYSALQRRSAAALNAHVSTGLTGDAARMVIGLGPAGDFGEAVTRLASLATDLATVKETHHFYSLLMYFRFPEPDSSPSRLVLIMLDTTSLIQSALDPDRYKTLIRSGAVADLSQIALMILKGLDDALLRGGAPASLPAPDPLPRAVWRRRFEMALEQFRREGISTNPDEHAGFERYVELRSRWQPRLDGYRRFAGFEADDVDPGGAAAANSADQVRPHDAAIDLTAAA